MFLMGFPVMFTHFPIPILLSASPMGFAPPLKAALALIGICPRLQNWFMKMPPTHTPIPVAVSFIPGQAGKLP
jgi:hypothetical protein